MMMRAGTDIADHAALLDERHPMVVAVAPLTVGEVAEAGGRDADGGFFAEMVSALPAETD
jgi:hypothetical protein